MRTAIVAALFTMGTSGLPRRHWETSRDLGPGSDIPVEHGLEPRARTMGSNPPPQADPTGRRHSSAPPRSRGHLGNDPEGHRHADQRQCVRRNV